MAYRNTIYPVLLESERDVEENTKKVIIVEPPLKHKNSGRPKNKRIPSRREFPQKTRKQSVGEPPKKKRKICEAKRPKKKRKMLKLWNIWPQQSFMSKLYLISSKKC